MQLTILFLSQRVNAHTEEDYNKLKRLIRYVVGTMDLIACIGAIDLLVLMYFFDAAYAMCNDFWSHTSNATVLEYDIVYSILLK